MLQSLASIGAGIGIGFAYSWKLTLLIVGFAPFILMSGMIQMKVVAGNKEANRAAMEGAGKVCFFTRSCSTYCKVFKFQVAIEGIENIRTVAALTKEKKFHQDYCDCLVEPYRWNPSCNPHGFLVISLSELVASERTLKVLLTASHRALSFLPMQPVLLWVHISLTLVNLTLATCSSMNSILNCPGCASHRMILFAGSSVPLSLVPCLLDKPPPLLLIMRRPRLQLLSSSSSSTEFLLSTVHCQMEKSQ